MKKIALFLVIAITILMFTSCGLVEDGIHWINSFSKAPEEIAGHWSLAGIEVDGRIFYDDEEWMHYLNDNYGIVDRGRPGIGDNSNGFSVSNAKEAGVFLGGPSSITQVLLCNYTYVDNNLTISYESKYETIVYEFELVNGQFLMYIPESERTPSLIYIFEWDY